MKSTKVEKMELPDELNPNYLFSLINTKLLSDAVNGKIDLKELALKELKNRGLNEFGEWVGFKS